MLLLVIATLGTSCETECGPFGLGTCAECRDDSACRPETPKCDPILLVCVGVCRTDADCSDDADAPVRCEVDAGTCLDVDGGP